MSLVTELVPVSLRGYQRSWLTGDIVAALVGKKTLPFDIAPFSVRRF